MKKGILTGLAAILAAGSLYLPVNASNYNEFGQYGRPGYLVMGDSDEQIAEEIRLGEMELVAQLVQAEAGNQPFEGKCLVVDVILNRVESPLFPNTIEEVIFDDGQFSVIKNGAFDKAAWNMDEETYRAVEYEFAMHENKEVLYFNNNSHVAGTGKKFKVGGHWFRNG